MKCPYCGYEIREDWSFCPKCGSRLKKHSLFDSIFKRMEKEIDSMLERDFEMFDLSPFFGNNKSKGFSIKITQSGNRKPKISIETFGNKGDVKGAKGSFDNKREHKKFISFPLKRTPKTTEEPKTDVKRIGDTLVVEIYLPGVKSKEDIEITQLENSIEVKAFADDRAFFKILTKPKHSRIVRKSFENGRLTLHLSLP